MIALGTWSDFHPSKELALEYLGLGLNLITAQVRVPYWMSVLKTTVA